MDLYNLVVSAKLSKGGGGDEPVLIDKSITENGTYKASNDNADGYKKVTVSVPSSGITPSGTSSITANGIYDITSFASVDVNVSGGGGDHDVEDAIIEKTISGTYINSRISTLGPYGLCLASYLTNVNLPNVSTIYNRGLNSCYSLVSASVPNLTYVDQYAFAYTALSEITLPKVSYIGSYAFRSCSSLRSVYLPGSSVPTLASSAAFDSTPIMTGQAGAYIYVPASLLSSYQAASNWSKIAGHISSIEG